MKRQWIALLLCLSTLFGTFGVVSLAVEGENQETPAADTTQESADAAAPAETPAPDATETPEESPAPDAVEEPASDPVGTLSFSSIRSRVLTKNYTALALSENIAVLDELDYKKIENDLRDGLNQIANQQFQLSTSGSNAEMDRNMAALSQLAAAGSPQDMALAQAVNGLYTGLKALQSGFVQSQNAALQSQYDSLKEQFDDVKNGKLQEDNAGVKRQLVSVQEQLVGAAETLYITLLGLETSDAGLTRSLQSLDSQLVGLRLRYEMGQISALQLQQINAGRAQLVSGQETLRMNMQLLRMQLNTMIGEAPGTVLALQPLDALDLETITAIDPAKDLYKAKEASYDVYALGKDKEDAQETYDEAVKKYGVNSTTMEFSQAKHNWQAAQYTYSAGIVDFEVKFQTQYLKMMDAVQILKYKQSEVTLKQSEYSAAFAKYQQGAISGNDLRSAEDALADARDAVTTAQQELYTNYNAYCRAVNSGILN